MDSKILLKSLVDSGSLTQDSVSILLRDSVSLKKDIEDLIVERKLVTDEELAKTKSSILGVPYKLFKAENIVKELLEIMPEATARAYKVFPLERDKNLLVVGMLHPDDGAAQEALRFVAKQNKVSLGVYLITQSDFDTALRLYAPFSNEIQQAVQSLNIKDAEGGIRRVELQAGSKIAEEAPIIKIVSTLLKEAVQVNASDIHIEPERTRLRIRYRINGNLKEQTSLPAGLQQPIISRVKILSDLKIDENRVPQDGRFRTEIFGRDIDFRVSTFPTPMGEKVAIRVLDPTTGLKSLDDLGLIGRNKEIMLRAIEKPFGMILITGPTGSGKTTTLYALLQILNKENVNIISLEDPVEYFVEGVNQSQVRPEIGYDFASGLRQILRQDPDIIMVGEIRDSETAALAVHAALTGHIVFSTLHTNNAAGVAPRLIDMKVDSFLLPSALNLMLSQRLVGAMCQKCKVEEIASGDLLKIIKEEINKLSNEVRANLNIQEPYKIYHTTGCEECGGKGVVGRTALFEVLEMTREMGEIITSGVSENKIEAESIRQGMITLRQDGILKALNGLVSLEEVLKETSE